MRLYQVIVSLATGEVYELDLHAPDAIVAATFADEEIRNQQPEAHITTVHARAVQDTAS